MKAILLYLIQKVGSEVLLILLEEVAKILKNRPDNSMDKDADEVIKLARRNYRR